MEEIVDVKITIEAPNKNTRGHAKRMYFIGKWQAMKNRGREFGYEDWREINEFLAPLVSIEGKPEEMSNLDFLWEVASEENFDQIFTALQGGTVFVVPPEKLGSSGTP